MKLIDVDAAAPVPPLALVQALREGHRTGDIGTVERLLVGQDDRAALTWVAWHPRRGLAVKTATVFPDNARTGKPNVQSIVTLFDGADGAPVAVIAGEGFTRMKTAADSALAVDLLANAVCETLAVLGAGGQAETHVRFIRAVRPSLRRVVVWNRTPAAATALADRLAAPGLTVDVAPTPRHAVEPASIVSCLTAAATPVLEGAWLSPGAHVDLVGGYTPDMRESDDAVVRRGRLFADSWRFGVDICGDYAQPLAAGVIAREAVRGDLFDLCAGRVVGRTGEGDITVFKNGGGGHLDLMIARALYEAALLDGA
jgi:ornithine cyclodeaminase